MLETVIISRVVSERIPFSVDSEYTIAVTDDVIREMESLALADREGAAIAVVIIDAKDRKKIDRHFSSGSFPNFVYNFILCGTDEEFISFLNDKPVRVSDFRVSPFTPHEFRFTMNRTFAVLQELHENRMDLGRYIVSLADTRQDQDDLINIGRALSSEKDMEKLLRLILFLSKKITGADAGSIYLVETDENGVKRLRFKYSHTYSREIPLEEFVMEMNTRSIAGYVAVTGAVQNIPDAYNIPPDAPYVFNSSFDKQHDYISRSMLVVPMKNHIDEIIGVIQLINSKEDFDNIITGDDSEAFGILLETLEDFDRYVVTFDKKYDSLLEAIAGQAAVAIENNRLINQIQNQFEEFVRASVTAIESRDPATSGHSFRVAEICTALARAVNNVNEGYLKDFVFTDNDVRELEFASLLHDFGKVYIDLSIFKKAKKLFPTDFENLTLRLEYLYRYLELQYLYLELKVFERKLTDGTPGPDIEKIVSEKDEKLSHIKDIKRKITELNEPRVMDEDPAEVIDGIVNEIERIECLTIDGECLDIISDNNIMNLAIKRGSLNPVERQESESQVTHTYSFVRRIPWPPEYRNIPDIALRHHEKLDGSGYPDGLAGRESTLLQSRMMAIADIYDALAASDRPYKKAVPLDRVLSILREEAENNKLDRDLVELFISEKIYEKIGKVEP